MTIRTFSSREFNQLVGEAKRAANDGPVLITEGGEPAYALLSIKDYYQLQGKRISLADALAQDDGDADFDFDAPSAHITINPADLS
jgi:prevent-host-death family protein